MNMGFGTMGSNIDYINYITFDDDIPIIWRYSIGIVVNDIYKNTKYPYRCLPGVDPCKTTFDILDWLNNNFGSDNFKKTWRGILGANYTVYYQFANEEDAVLFELRWS